MQNSNIQINPSIFRAYDIRGTAEPTEKQNIPDLTEESIYLIGKGVGTYLTRKYQVKNMMVGRDNRLHSEKLQNAFINGVLTTGLNVQNVGLATSPMIYFASCFYDIDSAVNITASHNPKYDNGLKIVLKNASSIVDQELQEILKLIQKQDFYQAPQKGTLSNFTNLPTDYQNKIVNLTHLQKKLKVVIDAGNGVTGAFAPQIFKELGCEVIELYCDLDGNFPNHEANPENPQNMIDLGNKVLQEKADIGIAFDGDGDRVGIVDQNGKFYSAEYIILLLALDLLKDHPNEKIIHDVKTRQFLIDEIKKHNGIPVMSRVGHSFIKERLIKENATLAGEKSGHIFFGERYFNYFGFDDGIFAAAKIVEILSKQNHPISENFKNLPNNPNIPELKIPCPDQYKSQIINEISQYFQSKYNCITLDGVRIQFEDGAWMLVRQSNTSPYLTIHAEALTQDRLDQIKELVFSQLQKFPQIALSN